ncbi:MAG: hypothetical protein ACFFDN_02075 [Candidatus Hodarchaeota archaeon]
MLPIDYKENNKVLMIRSVSKNQKSYNDFKWNLEIDAINEAKDFNDNEQCGNGLHGYPWGFGVGSGSNVDLDHIWFVFETNNAVKIQNEWKAKCKTAKIIKVGTHKEICDFIKPYFEKCIIFLIEQNKNNSSSGDGANNSSSGDYAKNSSSGYGAKNSSSGDYAKNSSSGDYAKNSSSGYGAKNSSSGHGANNSSSGDYAKNSSSGNYANNSSSGDGANNSSSGDYANNSSSGNGANNSSSGDYANNSSSGNGAKNSSSGDYANNSSSGDGANNSSCGHNSKNESTGKNCVIAMAGNNSRFKMKSGIFTIPVFDNEGLPLKFITGKIGKKYKADTWYHVVNGKLEKVKD